MPNGGSDNCNSCRFNERNEGRSGYPREVHHGSIRCILRDVEITNTHWTYCSNHPNSNPNRHELPVGPVDKHDGVSGRRIPPYASPDTPEIRDGLLHLLSGMSGDRRALGVELTAIKQLGQWKEPKAVDGLRRVLTFEDDRGAELAYALISLALILGEGAERGLELHLDRVRSKLPAMNRSVDAEMAKLASDLLSA